jgi:hypothetical protein
MEVCGGVRTGIRIPILMSIDPPAWWSRDPVELSARESWREAEGSLSICLSASISVLSTGERRSHRSLLIS